MACFQREQSWPLCITITIIYNEQITKPLSPPATPSTPTPTPTPSNVPSSPHCSYDLHDIHNELVHSFQNRHIYPRKGLIVSTHRLSCPTGPPPPCYLLTKPWPPRPYKLRPPLTGYSTCRIHLVDKLMHFLSQLSHCVPLRKGFYSFRAQTDYHHPVDSDSYTVVARGAADLYS